MTITSDISIEELVEKVPEAVSYLSKNGIMCIQCGEPIWGTLEEVAKDKGFNADDITQIVKDLSELSRDKT
ncbi:MAG: DUF1858 domain-containing protein [Candidatus Zixiibacteriota bacterium]|nr:MAG: DUF1858 domain-containing protein [candidate division Zixibacteria bacterium]